MFRVVHTVASRRNDEGASAVEYGLLVAGIAALIVLVVFALGGFVKGAFSTTCTAMSSNVSSATPTATCG